MQDQTPITTPTKLRHRCDFNVAAMSFSAGELASQIRKRVPTFVCDYRQAIADSWPQTIDDNAAREEWGWRPTFNLEAMTADMLEELSARQKKGTLWPR